MPRRRPWGLALVIGALAAAGVVYAASRPETTVTTRTLQATAPQDGAQTHPDIAERFVLLEADGRAAGKLGVEVRKLGDGNHRLEVFLANPDPPLYGITVRVRAPSGSEPLLSRLRMSAPGPGLSPLTYSTSDGTLRVATHGLRGLWGTGFTHFHFHLESRELGADTLPDALPIEIDVDLRAQHFGLEAWKGSAQFRLPLADLTAPGQ